MLISNAINENEDTYNEFNGSSPRVPAERWATTKIQSGTQNELLGIATLYELGMRLVGVQIQIQIQNSLLSLITHW